MGNVQHATDDNFTQKISTNKPVLIDFWATWCGPCRQVAPIVDAIATENDEYTVVKVDVDESPQTAQKYGIMSIPTFLILNSDGTPSSQIVGSQTKTALMSALNKTN